MGHRDFGTRQRWLLLGLTVCFCVFASQSAANELRVLSFNILTGGGRAEADAILASGADLIGIQEGNSDTTRIADLLGFHSQVLSRSQRGASNGIISRFPITEAYDNGVQVDMGPLGAGYIFSVHLTSCPYQPYELHPQAAALGCGTPIVRDTPAEEVEVALRRAASVRSRQLQTVLDEISTNVPQGAPVFLVGDFNEPSHLDWTVAAGPNGSGLHTHEVPWPSSIQAASSGFVDSYRQLHPDETTALGYTWTTRENRIEVHDRIDFVYYQGDHLTAVDSILVGGQTAAGGVSADLTVPNYPSDHRAVLTTFVVVPEPSTWATAAVGICGLIGPWRRRISQPRHANDR